MSQTIGIHLGERSFHLVALDGNLKKHKLVCAASSEIPVGEGAAEAVIERLRALAKEHKLRADSVYLAIDSGSAAFRTLTLPFDDREKIEEVIKYEVEGNLPQFDIEQVVVDFLILSSKPGIESNLLVTAVPKDRLSAALRLCERAGLETLDAELDGTALFDAAFESGILAEEKGTVLIHVGETTTVVAVANGRRLASLRAIRAGTGSAGAAEGGEPATTEAERLASAQRLRRELQRTLAGAQGTVEIHDIYVCGQHLEGLEGESLLELPIQRMPFELGGVETPWRYVAAFGAALRGFEGGTLRPNLRRDELRFSGRFERLELPLAVLSLLVFTLLFVRFIVLDKQLEWRDEGNLAKDIKGDMQIWLEASNQRLFPDPTNPRAVRLPNAPETLLNYAQSAQAGTDSARTKYQEIQHLRALMQEQIRNLSRDLGQVSEIQQPQSALEASTLVMNMIASLGDGARVGVRRLEANYTSSATKDDSVLVTLDADFFGASSLEATRLYNSFEGQMKAQPWCVEFEAKSNKSLDGDKGIQVDGLTIQVNTDKGKPASNPE